MVEVWLLAWLLWSITVWYQVVFWLPARKAITECTHVRGKLKASVPDRTGRPSALVWWCDGCSLQLPMQMIRGPKTDRGLQTWLLLEDVMKGGQATMPEPKGPHNPYPPESKGPPTRKVAAPLQLRPCVVCGTYPCAHDML